jgi:hypothetical protein
LRAFRLSGKQPKHRAGTWEPLSGPVSFGGIKSLMLKSASVPSETRVAQTHLLLHLDSTA